MNGILNGILNGIMICSPTTPTIEYVGSIFNVNVDHHKYIVYNTRKNIKAREYNM